MRITTKGLTSKDGTVELGRCTFITGPVGSGKSRIADALRWIPLGFIPALGKTEASVAQRMPGRELMAELEHEGRVGRRTLRATAKGLETEAFASWLERGKHGEHSSAILGLFGPDQEAVAECLDVRVLLQQTGSARQARLQQLLEAGTSAVEKAPAVMRYTLQSLLQIDEERMPADYLDLRPLVPEGHLDVLRRYADTLKARLKDTGLVGALEWANKAKREAAAGLEKKTQARDVLVERVKVLPESTETDRKRKGEERDLIQQAVGALKERIRAAERARTAFTAAVAELDRARGARDRAVSDLESISDKSASLPRLHDELAAIETEIDSIAVAAASTTAADLREKARAEDSAATSIKAPEIPVLTTLEVRIDRVREELADAQASPWVRVAEIAGELDAAAGKFKSKVSPLTDDLRRLAADNGKDPAEIRAVLQGLEGELERRRAEAATVTAARDAALDKARAHRAEAERLRKVAGDVEAEAKRDQEAVATRRGELVSRRNVLRQEIEAIVSAERTKGQAAKDAEADLARAEEYRSKLGDTAPEVEAGLAERQAELDAITADVESLTAAAAERETLRAIIQEIDNLGSERAAFAALEAGLKRARAEELAEAGGPLIKIMTKFLAAAGRPEIPYIDPKKDAVEIGWREPDSHRIPVAALCSGHWTLFVSAFNAAVLILRGAAIRPLIVEADNCDRPTLEGLLRGISAVSDDLTVAVVLTHQAAPQVEGWDVIDMGAATAAAEAA